MNTVDERIEQLLEAINDLAHEADEDCKLPLYSDTVMEVLTEEVKKFMQDIGEKLVKVQVLNDFAEWCNHRGLEMDWEISEFKVLKDLTDE